MRDSKVLLDTELAQLYGVATKVLLQAVRSNAERFPADLMFQLAAEEWEGLVAGFDHNAAGAARAMERRHAAPMQPGAE